MKSRIPLRYFTTQFEVKLSVAPLAFERQHEYISFYKGTISLVAASAIGYFQTAVWGQRQ